jgi:endonuclease G
MIRNVLLAFAGLILLTCPVRADYLKLCRSANIKSEPNSKSATVQHLDAGVTLALVSDEQTNGYYNATLPPPSNNGWIYRTFVRRYHGEASTSAFDAPNPLGEQELELTDQQKGYAARHLSLGKPEAVYERVMEGYVLAQDARLKIPLWVQYELCREEIEGLAEREDKFRADTSIPFGARAELSDYRGSGFDRGHMAPAGDMHRSDKVMAESFLLSNMTPQLPSLNRGIWQELESDIRSWAARRIRLTIITGPIFTPVGDSLVSYLVIGRNHVAVPNAFYKIVVDNTQPESPYILSFIIPNKNMGEHNYSEFLVTVDSVEALTGVDFLSALPDLVEDQVESRMPENVW